MTILEPCILYPIRFAADHPTIRVYANNGTGNTETLTLDVHAGTDYYNSGDGEADDLCTRLEDCFASHSRIALCSIAVAADNQIEITFDGAVTSCTTYWTSGYTTVDSFVFGFEEEDVSGITQDSDYQTGGYWCPSIATRAIGVRDDTYGEPAIVGASTRSLSGLVRAYRIASPAERKISLHLIDREKMLQDYATATYGPYGSFEYIWTYSLCQGATIRFYGDRTSRTTTSYGEYACLGTKIPWKKMAIGNLNRYEIDLSLIEVT